MSQPEHRIAAIETALVSLPLDRPVITPIHRIPAVDCVLVTLRTDSGLQGIAYLWCFGALRARALAALVEDMFAVVHGRDALAGETAWRAMWNEANFLGRTGAVMFALSAIDTALWDIRGKAADLPLWRLLGGERRKVPVYAGGLFLSDPIDAIVAEAKRYVAAGFGAMKMRTGAKTASEDIARVEAVRDAIGPGVTLMVDVVQGWTVEEAIKRGREISRFNLFWIEDPVLFDDLEGLAAVAAALDVPVTAGENDYGRRGFRRLVEHRAADILMPDLQRVGGISEWLKTAALADAHGLRVTPHVFPETSIHLMGAAPNAIFLEHVPWWDRLFVRPLVIESGFAEPTDAPGLGLAFDWDRLEGLRIAGPSS